MDLRWGEAIVLRVRDVEFLKRRLTMSENDVQLGADHAVGQTKRRKARSVPVPGFVLDRLSALCTDRPIDALVFPAPGGGYLLRPKSSGGRFAGALKRAGVQAITPHDLQHSCASLAVSAGVNVLALQCMLGHTSAKVTLDTYTYSTSTSMPLPAVWDCVLFTSEWAECGHRDGSSRTQ
jgi:integrase